MEERGGGEQAGRAVPSRILVSPLHLSLKLECQWDGQGGREREHNKEDRGRGKNEIQRGAERQLQTTVIHWERDPNELAITSCKP